MVMDLTEKEYIILPFTPRLIFAVAFFPGIKSATEPNVATISLASS